MAESSSDHFDLYPGPNVISPPNAVRLSMGSAGLQASVNGAAPGPIAGQTGLISGGTSGADLTNAIAAANAAGGGTTIELGKGTYNWIAKGTANQSAIQVVGNGPGSTFLRLDDAGGLAGDDAFLVNSVLNFALRGMTVIAASPRTAGSVVKVLGVNNITHTPAQRTRQYTIEDVDMEDQFNGVVFNDGPANAGAWGGFINRCEWVRFNTGGVGIWVNSPHGGQHYISNLKTYNSDSIADASRALAAIRYQGGADLELDNVNTIYFRTGLLIDPTTSGANVTIARGCEFDNNTQASVKIAPSGSGSVLGVTVADGWGYTPASTGQPCIQIDGGEAIMITENQFWGCLQGVRVSGPARRVLVSKNDASGSTAGFYATSSAAGFRFLGNVCNVHAGVTPTVGIQVDAGCDHYVVTDNDVHEATTPMTITPVDSANRRISTGNITA